MIEKQPQFEAQLIRPALDTWVCVTPRKLLDGMAGVAIYRDSFRVRPYGDAENDWLTLDAKRVQNPTQKIGRNQVAGIIVIEGKKALIS